MARYYRRSYRSRKPKYTTYGSAKFLARKAYSGVKFLKSIVNAEKKFFDTLVSGSLTNAGTVNVLNAISAGDDAMNRNGNSIKLIHLYCRMTFEQIIDTKNFVRIIIFSDLANQGIAPSTTDVLTVADVDSMTNLDNVARFQILFDKCYGLSNAYPTVSKRVYQRLGFHIKFDGTASGDWQKNSLFVLMLDSNTTSHAVSNSTFRIAYYDN